MDTKIILYAEDNPDDVLIFQRAFRKATLPHTLLFVADGEEAVEWLSGQGMFSDRVKHPAPNVLILDLKMPRKGGFDVLQWARASEAYKNIPALILSSSDDPRDVQKARELGATKYFLKSASSQDILDYLRNLS